MAVGVALAVVCTACQTGAPRQTAYMASLPGLDLSTNELRFLVFDYHDYVVSTIENAASDMVLQQVNPRHQLNTLVWRNNSVSAAQGFAFSADPLDALAELIVLSARQRDYFEGAVVEELFGPSYPIAVGAAHAVYERGRELAHYITDVADLEARLARLDSVAAADPIEDLTFMERSGPDLPESLVPEGPRGLAALGSLEQTTRDLSDRVNIYYRYLPRQLRWEMELVALSVYDEYGEDLFADFERMSDALESMERRLATLTDSLVVEIEALAEDVVARERATILSEIDRERIATIEALHAELEFLLADVERQRTETILSVSDLVAGTRSDVAADVDAAVDDVLRRITRLLLGFGVGFFVALAALVILFNRTRPEARTT